MDGAVFGKYYCISWCLEWTISNSSGDSLGIMLILQPCTICVRWAMHVYTHVCYSHLHTHPLLCVCACYAWERAGKSLLELVCRSCPAVFVPAVLVNSFSILTQASQQEKRAKQEDVVKHAMPYYSIRGCGSRHHDINTLWQLHHTCDYSILW